MRKAARPLLVIVVGLLSAGGSLRADDAAPSAESVTAHLTGGSQRVWIKEPMKLVLTEVAPRCVGGEVWTFQIEGTGLKTYCDDGIKRQQEFRWSWIGVEHDDPVLEIDEEKYIAVLRQIRSQVDGDPPVYVTILRTPRTSQDIPVEEIKLKFQDL